LNLGRKLHQLQLASAACGRSVCCHQFAQAAAVDIEHLGHVEQDLLLPVIESALDQVAKPLGCLAKRNRAL